MNGLKPVLTLLICAAASGAQAAAEKYVVDSDTTTPEFEVAHLGFDSLHGHFDKASGTVMLDFAAHSGSVDLTIDTTSVQMGSGAWSAQLRDPGLLDVGHYPTMNYRAERLIFQGSQVVGAEGSLTLRGVTRPVFLDVANFKCGNDAARKRHVCAGEVSAVIKRSDFGLGQYLNEVSDEVKIRIPVEAYRP